MRHAIILCFSTLLGACTSLEALRPDMEARPLPSRADEIAYINGLREAYEPVSGKPSVPCYTGSDLRPFRPKFTQGYREWDPQQETAGYPDQCIKFKDVGNQISPIQRYLESGFGLTDLYCQRYFTIATETRQSRKVQRDTFKAGDTLVNAVMLALGSPEAAIGLSNAGFAGIDSTYKNIDDAFVVAPDRDDVRKLVHGAQQKFRAEVFAQDGKEMPKSYASSRSVIERYAGLCTFDGMRELVAVALKETADRLDKEAKDKKEAKVTPVPPKTPPEQPTTAGASVPITPN